MKTIKNLEGKYTHYHQGYRRALKDVLELIDEAPIHWASKRWIKQKIQG